MFPENIYLTGAGWLGYFIYVPIALAVIGLLYWLLLRRIPIIVIRIVSLFIISAPLLTFPLWEALSISYEAEKLCKEQGGLHVYRTVETEGFVGMASIEEWSRYGFSYIEWGSQNKKYRYMMENEKKTSEEIPEFTNRYYLKGSKEKRINDHIKYVRYYYIEDQQTGEVLGELVRFKIYPSRFDALSLKLMPVEYNPWICGNESPEGEGVYSTAHKKRLYRISDVIKATLKPIKNKGEGQ